MNPENALSQLSPGMAECHTRLMAVAKHGTTEAFSATLAGVLQRAELSISNAYDAGAKSSKDAAAVPSGATAEIAKAFREYLAVHPSIKLGGHEMDAVARELALIAVPAVVWADALRDAENLLRRDAESLREGHTSHRDREDWTGEDDAKAGYDEYIRAADALAALAGAASRGKAPAHLVTVEQVEDAIGLQSTAWDTIDAKKIVEAVLRLANAKAPAAGAVAGPDGLDGAFYQYKIDAASTPAAQAADSVREDAARWQMAVLVGNEVMLHPDKRSNPSAVKAYMDAVHSGLDLTGAVDAARKQGAKHD